jgi:hypothetical protein
MTTKTALWLAALLFLTTGACHAKTEASVDNFTAAMTTYLQQRGDLCIARSDWPVDVTLDDFAAKTRDAIQLPALERLGLVDSSVVSGASKVTRYQLTAEGRRHYLDRETHRAVSPESPRHGNADFCVAHLALDKIVGWDLHQRSGATTEATTSAVIRYTYRVEAPAWTRAPAARRAFPAVDRVINGAHAATLDEEVTLTAAGWVANELLPQASPEPRPRIAATTRARP